MRFYSGFSLQEESAFFDTYLKKGQYNVAGFSYGAIKAFEYVLTCKDRIDILQLFSPAFFQNRSERFRRLQLLAYGKNKERYLQEFRQNCFAPYPQRELPQAATTQEELYALLYYVWDVGRIQSLHERGIKIEVYVGEADHIVDAQQIKDFFLPYATTYLIKDANHFLQNDPFYQSKQEA